MEIVRIFIAELAGEQDLVVVFTEKTAGMARMDSRWKTGLTELPCHDHVA